MKKLTVYIFLSLFIVMWGCGNGDENSIEESGTIEATNVIVSSKVAGTIKALLIDEGALAKAGDTVLIIDHELYDIQLKQVSAGMNIAKAKYNMLVAGARSEDKNQAKEILNQAEANYNLALADKERYTSLFESKAITKKQYDDIVTRFNIAESQFKSAKENFNKIQNYARPEEIEQAKGAYEQSSAGVELIQKNIRDCYVTAPMPGHVVKNFVEIGETVSPMTSLIKMSDQSVVELVVYISEENLGKVKLGQRAEITTDSYEDKTYEGKIVYISPEAEFTPKNIQTKDERTKLVFAVKIEIPNPNFELKAGMPADAKIFL